MTFPILEDVVKETISNLRENKITEKAEVLAVLRSVVMDSTKVTAKSRTDFVKLINKELGTEFSLNNIRRANPSQLKKPIVKKEAPTSTFTGVSEVKIPATPLLHNGEEFDVKGTAVFCLGFHNLTQDERLGIYKNFANNLEGELPSIFDRYMTVLEDQALEVIFYSFLESYNLWDRFKESVKNMDLIPYIAEKEMDKREKALDAEINNTGNQSWSTDAFGDRPEEYQAKPPHPQRIQTAQEEAAMINEEMDKKENLLNGFIAQLASAGFTDAQKRQELYEIFMGIYPQHRVAIKTASMTNPNNDKVFFDYLDSNKEAMEHFSAVLFPESNTNRGKSVNGEKADAMCKWIAAGAAVVTAGVEMVRTGNVTIGSAIGTAAGAAGAYFSQEIFTDRLEGNYMKYGTAVAFGAVMGLGGVTAGRLAENKIVSFMQPSPNGEPAAVPTFNLPSFSTPAEVTVEPMTVGSDSIKGFQLQF